MTAVIRLRVELEVELPAAVVHPDGPPAELTADMVVAELRGDGIPVGDWVTEFALIGVDPSTVQAVTVHVEDVRPNPHYAGDDALFSDLRPDPTITIETTARWA